MPDENTIPSSQPRSGATFTILSEGEKLPASLPVLSLLVQREVNRIAAATIMLQDGDAASGNFTASNGEWLIPGKQIEIKAGYRSEEETIFKGMVIRHSVKVRKNISMLVVECRHPAFKMTTHLKNAYFHDISDSDAGSQLCSAYGISLSSDGEYLQHKELVQFYSTDWDFMLCRAEANGAWVITNDDGTISMAPPDAAQEAVLTARFGATIKELDAEIDGRLQFDGWKAVGWSPEDQALLEDAEATDPNSSIAGNLSAADLASSMNNNTQELRHNSLPENELKKWADASLQKSRLAKIRGRAKIDGTASVLPGKTLEISGAGERFNGKVLVTGMRHQLEKNQWETIVQFGDNPSWHAETFRVHQPLAGALLPPVQGLHIGIVTDLEDPEGAERIKVRMPMVSATDDGAWMRLGSLDAGNNRGWVFRPEVDDEVIVGFINNDPRFGVVLGKLHSAKNAAPIAAKNDNHEKGYVSRSEMKLHFDDDKKLMTLSTPAGNSVQLDEENKCIKLQDQHGNKIEMNEDGIAIESIKEIKIKATTELNAEAGSNANIKASAQLKAEGSGGAELSAGGNTVVKGAMVQIN